MSEYDKSQSFKMSYIEKSQSLKAEQQLDSPEPLGVIQEKEQEEK